jgi:putative membrane protein
VSSPRSSFDPASITRPDPALMRYYVLCAAMTLAGFPFMALAYSFKYHTLRYRFDDRGVSMSWGLLFKREIYLTYRRIQDIHVTRNLFHRWLGLADVSVQTASGSSGPEMVIQGIRDPEGLRDFLYSQMRGARDESGAAGAAEPASGEQVLALLGEIRDELRRLRAAREGGA